MRHRGFNQSSLIAQHVGRILNVPVDSILIRTRRTEAQVRLGAAERYTNVRGAIETQPNSAVVGRSFVLVDDVVTTGSTLSACASALVQAGALSVKALTVAREM
ncbi:MAG: ComF family protein [Chloroflexia bacterium]|nr:ComF family protein [Chloroflexia bacterium]